MSGDVLKRWPLIIAGLSLLIIPACEPKQAPTPAPVEPAAAKPPAPPTTPAPDMSAPSAPAPSFAVIEWGALLFDADGAAEFANHAPPKPTPKPTKPPKPKPKPTIPTVIHREATLKKPVIYFEADPGFDLSTPLKITATFAGGGKVHEVWPTPANGRQPAHGESYTWSKVKLTQEDCAAGWAPTTTSPACASLPDPAQCEAADFAKWVDRPAKCLDVDGVPAPALLYNGYPPENKSPLVLESSGRWRNASADALSALWLSHGDKLYFVESLEAGVSLEVASLPTSAVVARAALPAAVRAQLLKLGLSEPIADDFMRAWGPLLNAEADWQSFGFFSARAIEQLITLDIEPKPHTTSRVLAFFNLAPTPAKSAAKPTVKAKVTLAKPMIQGDMPPGIVQRVVLRQLPAVKRCYEQALLNAERRGESVNKLNGRAELEFMISDKGTVLGARASSMTLPSALLQTCLQEPARGWAFPRPRCNLVRVKYPVRFSI